MKILSLCNKFDIFNNTGACMLDSMYHMTLKLLLNCFFSNENAMILSYIWDIIMIVNT